MNSFADAIGKWPTPQDLADDMGVPITTAQSWLYRDSIPNTRWAKLIEAARGRGIRGITYAALGKLTPGRQARQQESQREQVA